MPLAVVFDCDGVLVDSEPVHMRATQEVFRTLAVDLPAEEFPPLIGMRVSDQVRRLVSATGVGEDPEELFRRREVIFWELVRHDLQPMPGAVAAVRALSDDGCPLAVVSSGTRRWIDHVLGLVDHDSRMAVTVSGEEVTHPKPHPEPYLRAATALGIEPERCVVIEDAPRGVASARAAGMRVIHLAAVENALTEFSDADRRVTTMPEAVDVIRRWRRQPASSPLLPLPDRAR